MEKNKLIKYIRNFAFFVLLIVLTFWIIFKDQDAGAFIDTIKNSKFEFIIIGFITMCIFMCIDAINITRLLRHLNEKSSFLRNIRYSLIGFFFSAITPAATGGQPVQIYYMNKDGISIGSSTLTLLINTTCFLFTTITISLFCLIFNYQYLNSGLLVFYIFGTLINIFVMSLYLIAILSDKTLDKLKDFAKEKFKKHYDNKIKRIKKLKMPHSDTLIAKANTKCEERIKKLDEQTNKYKENASMIKDNKIIVLKTLLIYYIQYALYYTVAYLAYRALGLNTHTLFEVASLQSIAYATTSGIPSPGAVGASEAACIGLFKNIIPEALISSYTLLVRFLNFYLFVIISGIVVVITIIKSSKHNKKET